MSNILFEAGLTDERRRRQLYGGDLFVYQPRASSTQLLCDLARRMIEEAFHPHDPRRVHEVLPVEECVAILARLKPAFIHHPLAKEAIRDILRELGCDADRTYFDVPRLRSAYPVDYLSSGIAYAFHAHRDTWYSAPMCQINWWLPVYDLEPDNCLAFYPDYFSRAAENNSEIYNYYEWNLKNRATAAQHIGKDTREQPKLQRAIDARDLRVICPPGGLIMFSGAQLHETVPNTSGIARYSIDFRTVHYDDVAARRGADNVDSRCTGTTLRDYLRASDLERLPEEVLDLYTDGTEVKGVLIYQPA